MPCSPGWVTRKRRSQQMTCGGEMQACAPSTAKGGRDGKRGDNPSGRMLPGSLTLVPSLPVPPFIFPHHTLHTHGTCLFRLRS